MLNSLPIYCFAPSGKTPDIQVSHRAFQYLESKGFTVHNQESVQRSYQRFAGSDNERADEINDLAEITSTIGPSIALAIRGGYGLSRILPKIDWGALGNAVEQGLKIVGHSDLTSLEIALFAKTGQISYAGPMLNYDFGCDPTDVSELTWNSFKKLVDGENFQIHVHANQQFLTQDTFHCSGKLWGGNLAMICSLLNTSFFPDKSHISNGILFIEDVNEHPYRIERMLFQLLYAGVLATQSAIVLGDFSDYKLSEFDDGFNLEECILRIQQELRAMHSQTQIICGLPFGHCKHKLTLPIGLPCQLDANFTQFSIKSI
jgi:muramoyltetrapeptide carboxypeptidase